MKKFLGVILIFIGTALSTTTIQIDYKVHETSSPAISRMKALLYGANQTTVDSAFENLAIKCGELNCDQSGVCTRRLVVSKEEATFGFSHRVWTTLSNQTFTAAENSTNFCHAIITKTHALIIEGTKNGCRASSVPVTSTSGTGSEIKLDVILSQMNPLSTSNANCFEWSLVNGVGNTVLIGGYTGSSESFVYDNVIFKIEDDGKWKKQGKNVTGSGSNEFMYLSNDGLSFVVVDDIFNWNPDKKSWEYTHQTIAQYWWMQINQTTLIISEPNFDTNSGRIMIFKRTDSNQPWNITATEASTIIEVTPRRDNCLMQAIDLVGDSNLVLKMNNRFAVVNLDEKNTHITFLPFIKKAKVVPGHTDFVSLHYTENHYELFVYPLGVRPDIKWILCILTTAMGGLLIPFTLITVLCVCHKCSTPGGAHLGKKYTKINTSYGSINEAPQDNVPIQGK